MEEILISRKADLSQTSIGLVDKALGMDALFWMNWLVRLLERILRRRAENTTPHLLVQICERRTKKITYKAVYIKQEDWDKKRGDLKTFADLCAVFKTE